MNITILASVWCQNLWDELILKNTIRHFEDKYWEDTEFEVFTYDVYEPFFEQKNISYHEFFPAWIRRRWGVRRNIKNYQNFTHILKVADLVVIWGGGLFFDKEWTVSSLKNLNMWIFRRKLIAKYKKELVFYAVGINFQDDTNTIYQKKIDTIFSGAHEIYVRDTFSHNYLKKIWIWSEIILDPVYNDHKKYKEKKKLQLWKIDILELSPKSIDITDYSWKIVWLALRKLDIENYEQKIIETIEFLLQKWAKIIILPHSFHKYDEASNDLMFFKNLLLEYYEITDFNLIDNKLKLSHSLDETYNYYREQWLDLILASRLHSIILAKVYKIPYVGLSYSKKTSEQL